MIPRVVLQSCEYGQDMAEYITDGFRIADAFRCQFSGVGLEIAGFILMAAIFVPLYIRSRSPVIPLVLMLLVGGAFVSAIAGPWTAIAALVLLVVGAGGVTYLYAQYSP